MNIFLENVNLNSNSGPNYFAQKLTKYLGLRGASFNNSLKHDIKLAFIESHGHRPDLPMVQRLDGIYFNSNFDCEKMNSNIKRTYHDSQGVVFQTQFNKHLIFNWFGEHENYRVINNGSDVLATESIQPYIFDLAYLDHCPNVVIDARACGAKIICSSSGGTKEIAGTDAIVIKDYDWDFSFIESQNLPKLDFDKKISNNFNSDISMVKCSKKYLNFLKEITKNA